MFFCAKCATRKGWPHYGYGSYGPCEICGQWALCNDVPSKYLPLPAPKDNPRVTAVAVRLHSVLCRSEHVEHCSWYYETSDRDTVHDWSRYAHARYLNQAVVFIEAVGGIDAANKAIDGLEAIRGI